jgi:hypothetical protein
MAKLAWSGDVIVFVHFLLGRTPRLQFGVLGDSNPVADGPAGARPMR